MNSGFSTLLRFRIALFLCDKFLYFFVGDELNDAVFGDVGYDFSKLDVDD